MKTRIIVKKWGNSLGILIPKETVEKEKLKERDEIVVDIVKKRDVTNLFGTLKFKRSSQKMKEEDRKAWGE